MRIKRLRKKLGLSQEALARLLGVSLITVNRWEHGTKPSPLAEEKIGRLLKSTVSREGE